MASTCLEEIKKIPTEAGGTLAAGCVYFSIPEFRGKPYFTLGKALPIRDQMLLPRLATLVFPRKFYNIFLAFIQQNLIEKYDENHIRGTSVIAPNFRYDITIMDDIHQEVLEILQKRYQQANH